MKGEVVTQCSVERSEEIGIDNKDKKKRRRSRRSKPNSSSVSVSSSTNEIQFHEPEVVGSSSQSNCLATNGHNRSRASSVAFHSLPTMHAFEQTVSGQSLNLQNQQLFSSYSDTKTLVRSCLEPIVNGESTFSYPDKDTPQSNWSDDYGRRKVFSPYWSIDAVNNALEKGDAFKALFRVNVHNRLEAYCKIDGVQSDVLIGGIAGQNRAIEGDVVVIKVDPPSLWAKMKGLNVNTINAASTDESNLAPETAGFARDGCKWKTKIDFGVDHVIQKDYLHPTDGLHCQSSFTCKNGFSEQADLAVPCHAGGGSSYMSSLPFAGCSGGCNERLNTVEKLSSMLCLYPSKRPTGRVVAIFERSPLRDTIVGFLDVKQWVSCREYHKKDFKKNKNSFLFSRQEYILLTPTDPKFPKMMVPVGSLPDSISKRLENFDATVGTDLVAAQIVNWSEGNTVPEANVLYSFGSGSEIEPRIAAILFQNAIRSSEFPPETVSCLPCLPWEIPREEIQCRRDARSLCIFTIDPETAVDLDDALSVESLPNGIFRVGVHISDASYFVQPYTALDTEAQIRTTSVYLLQSKLPMLPALLSENLGSLTPGIDKLAFSIFWDLNPDGEVLDRWIGRTVIKSCCKLSCKHAQNMIDGILHSDTLNVLENGLPELHGCYEWSDVIISVNNLNEIAKTLRKKRFYNGALALESPKLVFLFDDDGIPFDSMLCATKDSNSLVEEFMLLANMTAAEVITRAYPSCSLLRRHPEPNLRKLREFEAFCSKHGLELDTSSSCKFHYSLERIRQELKSDHVLVDILMSYASRPMQLALYFCSGEGAENDWGHYALGLPFYTHFTSPLRRFPDIIVHRTLTAALEVEAMYLKHGRKLENKNGNEFLGRIFTGICFEKDVAGLIEVQKALSASAEKHGVPCSKMLLDIVGHCNERKLASRHVKDALEKLFLWVLLKRKKFLFVEARVLGLGPRFMSIYIHKLAIERRISYDEVEGLTVEWLETTSTVVLNLCANKRFHRRGSPGKWRALEEVALNACPCDLKPDLDCFKDEYNKDGVAQMAGDMSRLDMSDMLTIEPAFFPLTVRPLSTIPVVLHAVGGDDGPVDIGARLYVSSYLS